MDVGSAGNPIKEDKPTGVQLVQDFFGYYYEENGSCVKIKRFTWTNPNQIQVQVINYGARIISIKYPDRRGVIDDIVLGFDDFAGYLFYKKYKFGATIGRMTNIVQNASFKISDREYKLQPNMKNGHHRDGGAKGFDQIVWKTGIQGKKVFMTHVSPQGDQGYPGDLLVRLSFELNPTNEFKIDIEAYTTEPTIVNISNLLYFNLGGHHSGPENIYKHILTVNCNSYTKQDKQDRDGLCNGDIYNVVHTPLDFQTPKTLGKWIGIVPRDGYYQNLCVNRGVNQEDCFVARIRHPGSGRFVEVYSNQFGVQLDTANHLGLGYTLSTEQISLPKEIDLKLSIAEKPENLTLRMIDCLHGKMLEKLRLEEETYYTGFKKFIRLLQNASYTPTPTKKEPVTKCPSAILSRTFLIKESVESIHDDLQNFTCTPDQMTYLKTLESAFKEECFDETADWLGEVIAKLIFFATKNAEKEAKSDSNIDIEMVQPTTKTTGLRSTYQTDDTKTNMIISTDIDSYDSLNNNAFEKSRNSNIRDQTFKKRDTSIEIPTKLLPSPKKNVIPPYYKSTEQIVGKGRTVYRRQGGIALQTQNYPNCANFDNFPSCVLNPGETYRHTITYRFWIRSGDPSRWLRRTDIDIAAKKVKVLQQQEILQQQLQQLQQQQQQQKAKKIELCIFFILLNVILFIDVSIIKIKL